MRKILSIILVICLIAFPALAQPTRGSTGTTITRGAGAIGGATITCTDGCDFDIDTSGDDEIQMKSTGLIVGIGQEQDFVSDAVTISDTGIVVNAKGTADVYNLIPGRVLSDPCTVLDEGSIFWNDTANELCVCDGTNDVKVTDASTACF